MKSNYAKTNGDRNKIRIFKIQKVYKICHIYTFHLQIFFYKNLQPFVCNRCLDSDEYLWTHCMLSQKVTESQSYSIIWPALCECLTCLYTLFSYGDTRLQRAQNFASRLNSGRFKTKKIQFLLFFVLFLFLHLRRH